MEEAMDSPSRQSRSSSTPSSGRSTGKSALNIMRLESAEKIRLLQSTSIGIKFSFRKLTGMSQPRNQGPGKRLKVWQNDW